MVNNHTLDEIKRGLEKYLGRDVVVRANRGRKKFVKNDNHVTRVSYSYADILTSTVQLTLMRHEDSEKQKYA